MKEELNIEIKRKQIKNMYLRVKEPDGHIEVSAPYKMKEADIYKFVADHKEWIARNRQKIIEKQKHKQDNIVIVPFMEREMRAKLKKQIAALIEKWEPVMNVKSAGFTIKKMKTRWGSCNVVSHHLNFNLALANAPKECVEYVVVHELTHLLEPSHNQRFWTLMEEYLPGAKMIRKQLSDIPIMDMI